LVLLSLRFHEVANKGVIKTIGVPTSRGDCAGLNALIRAVV
jgi:hypothetical protein